MKHRLLRVNELLKRELSSLLVREMTFENLLVTVNQVDVTPDLKSAHVYISVLGAERPQGSAPEAGSESRYAPGRSLQARRLEIHSAPGLPP